MLHQVTHRRFGRIAAAIAALVMLTVAGTGAGSIAGAAAPVKLLETGSTLLYPLFNLWVPAYAKMKPGVQITTQGTGSGTGIAESISGAAQIGASDAYLSPAQKAHTPTMMNIPLAISAQQINYDLPG